MGEIGSGARRPLGLSLRVAFRVADGLGVELPELVGFKGLSGPGIEAGRLVSALAPKLRTAVLALLRGSRGKKAHGKGRDRADPTRGFYQSRTLGCPRANPQQKRLDGLLPRWSSSPMHHIVRLALVITTLAILLSIPFDAAAQPGGAPPAPGAGCKSNLLVNRLLHPPPPPIPTESPNPPPTPTLTDAVVSQITSSWLTQNFEEAREAIRCHKSAAADNNILDRLIGLEGQLAKIEAEINPGSYSLSVLREDECFNGNINDPQCQSRLAGFARAAWAFHNRYTCGGSMSLLAQNRLAPFRVGFVDWWRAKVDPREECEAPPKPTRCLVGWCWGGDDQYKYGIALRPALELGGSLGKGLGFSDVNGGATFQFSGSIGARFFFFHDAVDLHASFGIAASSSSSSSPGDQARGFLVFSPGVGLWNGLFSVNYIRTFDPFTSLGSGNGIGIFADTVAIERVVQQSGK